MEIHPVTVERWADVDALFGPAGASGGCWCMFWRLPNNELSVSTAEHNRAQLEAEVQAGRPVGLLAYVDGAPAGWCGVAPRPTFRRLPRTKDLADRLVPPAGDDERIWSVVCLYIAREHRRAGVGGALLAAATGYARRHGAVLVEAYPNASSTGKAAAKLSTGTVELFARAGFTRHGPAGTRAVMRLALDA